MPPYPLFSFYLSLGQNRQEGEGVMLASAPYTCPWWDIFHLGQKHTFWDCIRGIFRGGTCPPTPYLPFFSPWERTDKRGGGFVGVCPLYMPLMRYFSSGAETYYIWILSGAYLEGAYAPYSNLYHERPPISLCCTRFLQNIRVFFKFLLLKVAWFFF